MADSFTAIYRICGRCGARVSIPRYAPRPNREGHNYPPFLQRGGYVPARPLNNAEIKRFSDAELRKLLASPATWLRSGDKWDSGEIYALLEIGHVCSQGQPSHLENPIEVHEYMTKYRVQQNKVEQAILKGKIKAELIDGTLWLEDRSI